MQQTLRSALGFLPKVDLDLLKLQVQTLPFTAVAGAWIAVLAIAAIIVSLGSMGQVRMLWLVNLADGISNIGFPAFLLVLYFTKTQDNKKNERKSDLVWIALAAIIPQFAYYGTWIFCLNSAGGNMAVISALATGLILPVGLRYIRPQKPVSNKK